MKGLGSRVLTARGSAMCLVCLACVLYRVVVGSS